MEHHVLAQERGDNLPHHFLIIWIHGFAPISTQR